MLTAPDISEILMASGRNSGEKVFFAGIGGVSMSAIAEFLKKRGVDVCGYDQHISETSERLKAAGIAVFHTFSQEIYSSVSLVVYTNAIADDDPVLAYPRDIGIKCISRAELLGFIMLEKKNRFGIAGTHGKSSTTGMLSHIMLEAQRDPTVFIGAELPSINGNYRMGSGEDFIFEACEYKDSFLSFYPTVSVVLNTELDHVDYFGNIDCVIDSFRKFISIPGEDGFAVVNADCENSIKAARDAAPELIRYSVKRTDTELFASKITSKNGFYSFDICAYGLKYAHISLSIPGEIFVSNALAAAACAYAVGVPGDIVSRGLHSYTGIKRRFEPRGKCGGAFVADDYAHHPDEIRETLRIARSIGFSHITCVFQSHTYTRTKALFDGFTSVFSDCDRVIFADIYSARENPIEGVTAEALAAATKNGIYVGDMKRIAEFLRADTPSLPALIIVMGAGDIIELTDMLLDNKLSGFDEILRETRGTKGEVKCADGSKRGA